MELSGILLSASQEHVLVPLTPAVLKESMDATAAGILPWDGRRFRRVKQLQDAKRNHGCVELMREGSTFMAVKKMPTRWIRGSPDEFIARYPDSSEQPWMDVGLVRHLNQIRYPYCVKLLGVFVDSYSTYVVSSLASEGDLFAWCDRDPQPGLEREAAMYPLVYQIFDGVRLLHQLGIAHRDLSLENLLLNNEKGVLRIKIIDFGMSTMSRLVSGEIRGKQSYQAPEMHLPQPFDTFMTDPFSLGVVLFAMGAQDYPWSSTKRKTCELFEYVCMFGLTKFLSKRRLRKGSGECLADVFSPSFTAMLAGLLDKDVGKRFTLGDRYSGTTAGSGSALRRSVFDSEWIRHHVAAAGSQGTNSAVRVSI
ncbi:unnamed protein product [Prorocentrum cordatum]|uniref:Protein kinase domain-containing protein n=1 Tax=Prorocentrum cordatum TaxID=2364126 RepID=A0ABN9QVY0_9DINO|nr:unnamed protein product [Polarella glacialis]